MFTLGLGLIAAILLLPVDAAEPAEPSGTGPTSLPTRPPATASDYLSFLFADPIGRMEALERIEAGWDDRQAPMALEAALYSGWTGDPLSERLLMRLEDRFAVSGPRPALDDYWRAIWKRDLELPGDYLTFKRRLYSRIDPRFAEYFQEGRRLDIRLDQVLWGGVQQDGIPPLRSPNMLSAAEAAYLADDDVIFGLQIGDDVRAYPKRILAWHEMFTDVVGGIEVTGVYCTLCGSMILYESKVGDTTHRLGTSGFLYRSNKLMYDRTTQSLWSTLDGSPVIGPLAEHDITLKRRWVVTSTWGEWKRRHPDTRVLSLETGHERDYGEGVAYRDYFATDELMFAVPDTDARLANKAEVLALRFGRPPQPLAISVEFLAARPIFHEHLAGRDFVVVTDRSGASRVYDAHDVRFSRFDGDRELIDADGIAWSLDEAGLTAADGRKRDRLPAHRAFWFGWRSAFPETRLTTNADPPRPAR